MSSRAPTDPDVPDPWLEDAIARAERGRAQLQELAKMGMEIAESLREQAARSPTEPKPRHDPQKAIRRLSREVELLLAQAAQTDAHIAALREGSARVRPTPAPVRERARSISRKDYEAFLALTPPADRRDLH
jgi:hypothetical protein